jgi:hypothetical protein
MTDPLDEMIDAGTEAVLAAARGDEKAYKQHIKRGRAAYRQAQHANAERIVDALERGMDERRRQKRRKRPEKPLTQSMGDLLRAAGVTRAEG